MKLDIKYKVFSIFKAYGFKPVIFIFLVFSMSVFSYQAHKIYNLKNQISQINKSKENIQNSFLNYYKQNPKQNPRILNFNINNYSIKINSTILFYYLNKKRTKNPKEYIHSDKDYIKQLNRQLNKTNYLKNLIRFIHNIKYQKDSTINHLDYYKYPIETLIERTGDCEDTTFLMASLLKEQNYKVAILDFKNHFAIGIECKNEKFLRIHNHTKYCYLETTGKKLWQISDIPKNMTQLQQVIEV